MAAGFSPRFGLKIAGAAITQKNRHHIFRIHFQWYLPLFNCNTSVHWEKRTKKEEINRRPPPLFQGRFFHSIKHRIHSLLALNALSGMHFSCAMTSTFMRSISLWTVFVTLCRGEPSMFDSMLCLPWKTRLSAFLFPSWEQCTRFIDFELWATPVQGLTAVT